MSGLTHKIKMGIATVALVGLFGGIGHRISTPDPRGSVVEERTVPITYILDDGRTVSEKTTVKEYQNGTIEIDAGLVFQYYENPSDNVSPDAYGRCSAVESGSAIELGNEIYQVIMEQQ